MKTRRTITRYRVRVSEPVFLAALTIVAMVIISIWGSGCTRLRVTVDPALSLDQPFMECASFNPTTHVLSVVPADWCAAALKRGEEKRRQDALIEGRDPDAVPQ